jgi:hypothetical protein
MDVSFFLKHCNRGIRSGSSQCLVTLETSKLGERARRGYILRVPRAQVRTKLGKILAF